MGVLACDREGCDNIMCDHYSPKFGYICYSCLQELTAELNKGGWSDFDSAVEEFMGTRHYDKEIYGVEELVAATFVSRWD